MRFATRQRRVVTFQRGLRNLLISARPFHVIDEGDLSRTSHRLQSQTKLLFQCLKDRRPDGLWLHVAIRLREAALRYEVNREVEPPI